VVLFGLGMWLSDAISITRFVSGIKSRDALTDRAREVMRTFGYGRGVDSAALMIGNDPYIAWLAEHGGAARRWIDLGAAPPSPLLFLYRDSTQPLIVLASPRMITMNDPPRVEEGDTVVVLDHDGRLRRFTRVPPRVSDSPARSADWSAAFREAGLDMARFTPAVARWSPEAAGDRRYAWIGAYSERPDVAVRVEATSLGGRPVDFAVIEPWEAPAPRPRSRVGENAYAIVGCAGMIAAALLTWRNFARGRADRRGATRTAAVVALLFVTGPLLRAHHAATVYNEYMLLVGVAGSSLYNVVGLWLAYVAVEPYVRRRWPVMLIGWMRLIGGRARDPRVGAEILTGIAGGAAAFVVARTIAAVAVWQGVIPPLNPLTTLTANTPWPVAYAFSYQAMFGLIYAFGWLTLLLLFRAVTRSDVAAAALVVFATAMMQTRALGSVDFAMAAVACIIGVLVLRRAGLLAGAVLLTTYNVLLVSPPFAAGGIAIALVLLAATVWSFVIALGGKPLFGAITLEDEAAA
jgi:hypothetical protein